MKKSIVTGLLLSAAGMGCFQKSAPSHPSAPPSQMPSESAQRFPGLHWGGKGFDHEGKYTRFSAMIYPPQNALEIWIDQEKGATTARLVIEGAPKNPDSVECAKAERHRTAPMKCEFNLATVQKLYQGSNAKLYFKSGESGTEDSVEIPADGFKTLLKGE